MNAINGDHRYRIGATTLVTVQDIETGQWLAFMNAVPRLTAVADTEEKALGRLVIQIDVRHAEMEEFKASRKRAAEARKRKRNRTTKPSK